MWAVVGLAALLPCTTSSSPLGSLHPQLGKVGLPYLSIAEVLGWPTTSHWFLQESCCRSRFLAWAACSGGCGGSAW